MFGNGKKSHDIWCGDNVNNVQNVALYNVIQLIKALIPSKQDNYASFCVHLNHTWRQLHDAKEMAEDVESGKHHTETEKYVISIRTPALLKNLTLMKACSVRCTSPSARSTIAIVKHGSGEKAMANKKE